MNMFLRMWLYAAVLCDLLAGCYAVGNRPHKPTSLVGLNYAKYEGTALPGGITQWLGMRFAAPPLGDLRWRAPREPHHERGIQKADQVRFDNGRAISFNRDNLLPNLRRVIALTQRVMWQWKPACIGLFGLSLDNGASEDCLYLDVFAPSGTTPKSRLPVWFFIQGGGYAGNTDDNFNATEVIRQSGNEIVFVQVNYRVGAFGFLAGDEVRRDGDLNVGLLDQRKALEWAQKYIHLVS